MSPSILVDNAPGTGPFDSVLDYAKLQLRTGFGEVVDVNIPAPLPSLFTVSGGDRLDLTNALVITLVDALVANASSASGNPLIQAIGGRRLRVRR